MFFSKYFVPHQRVLELKKWLPHSRRKNHSSLLKRYHKPLAYVMKHQPFLGHNICVKPPILIPRPETEYWVGNLLNVLPSNLSILELCTGSGCIAKALAQKHHSVVAIDKNPLATKLAKYNNRGLQNVQIFQFDLFDDEWIPELANQFDVILANPPYIPQEMTMPLSVRIWEDKNALFGGPQGTLFHKRILDIAPKLLLKHVSSKLEFNVFMEIDSRAEQRKDLLRILNEIKIKSFQVEKDQFGRHRLLKCSI